MNGDKKQARRYHWHSENMTSFVDEPHSAIDGPTQGEIVNLTDKRAETSRLRQLDLLADLGPDRIVSELSALSGEAPAQALLPHLIMPAHHDVRSSDVFTRRLHGTLAAAAERGPADFPDLLLTPGVGARTIRSLAMVAEVVHGAPSPCHRIRSSSSVRRVHIVSFQLGTQRRIRQTHRRGTDQNPSDETPRCRHFRFPDSRFSTVLRTLPTFFTAFFTAGADLPVFLAS